MKVYRNTMLEGVISKKRALKLLGLELSVKHQISNVEIEISRDDMYDVWIDYADEELKNKFCEYEELD